jgi:hypothetical protein
MLLILVALALLSLLGYIQHRRIQSVIGDKLKKEGRRMNG